MVFMTDMHVGDSRIRQRGLFVVRKKKEWLLLLLFRSLIRVIMIAMLGVFRVAS